MILRATGLTRTYGSGSAAVRALHDVDFHVREGEHVSVMGPSGCGKSTLLRILAGLDRPDAGEIRFAERRVERLSEAEWAVLRRDGIGVVFQFFNLLPDLSVADNVELPALLNRLPHAEVRRRRQALLEELDLADRSGDAPAALSGGQQQRVALARALVNRPAVLLADEPTGNLDSASARAVLDVLRRAREWTRSIVLVTHDPRVAACGDRVVTMRDGRIVEETKVAMPPASSALLALEG